MYFEITPDDEFIKTKKVPGPTKEEIRALVISKVRLTDEDVVVDVGCGTGGLTVEFAQRAKKVYSIDKNQEAVKVTERNLKKLLQDDYNVELMEDDAVNALKKIDNMDIAVIGGSGRELETILDIVNEKLNPKGRILITSILVDTRVEAVNKLKDLNYNPQFMEINVSKGRILDRGILMKAENPIGIITASKH